MIKRQMLSGAFLSAAICCVGVVKAGAVVETPSAQVAGQTEVENVIVTARRREETAQTTPVSLTALTPATLARLNVNTPSDLTYVPGLVTMPQLGSGAGATAFIRGLGSQESLLSIDQPVGFYRDGIYIGHSATTGNTDMTTLERVEVLRGPQGTLFGRNTTGGAVNFVTRDPAAEFGFTQRFRYGSFNELMSSTTIDSGELGNSGIKVLLAYQHRERDGYVDDPTLGGSHDHGALNRESFFGKIKGEWGNLSFTYMLDYFDGYSRISAPQVTAATPTFLAYFGASPANGGQALPFGPSRIGTLDYLDIARSHQRAVGHAIIAQYEVSKSLTLKSISGWRNFSSPEPLIYGGNLRGLTTLSPVTPVYTPLVISDVRFQKTDQFTQEVQALGEIGEFNYTFGGFYLTETGLDLSTLRLTLPLSNTLGFPVTSSTFYSVDNDATAGYGQIEYKPRWADGKFELTAGIRYSEDHKRAFQTAPQVRTGDHVFTNTTYSVSAKYQWTPEVMTFARVSTGVRSGGFNIRAAANQSFLYPPERAESYEIGLKSDFFDGRVRLNAGAFYTKYDDLQISSFVATGSGIGGQIFSASANYKGGELELAVVPIVGLTLASSIGYVDPEYNEIYFPNPATGVITNYAPISKFPYLAKLNGNVSATYAVPLSFGTFNAYLSLAFLSERYFSINTLPSVSPFNDATKSPGHAILNGRIGIGDLKLGSTTAEINLWANNITNKLYRRQGVDFGALGFGVNLFSEPRTVGVDIKIQY